VSPARERGVRTAGAQRPEPAVELEHRARVVPEVAQQPPEPLGAAHVPVRDDEDAVADPGSRGRAHEVLGRGQRVAARRPGLCREVLVDVEKRRAGNVTCEVELVARDRATRAPSGSRRTGTAPR
jgi:hypothetical protein